MLDVTLEELVSLLGNPTRTTGHQHYFRCPACSSAGGDTSGDNLLFNDRKGVLKCFACDDGAKETLRMLNEKRRQLNPTMPVVQKKEQKQYTPWWQLNFENLYIYMCEAQDEMNKHVVEWLSKKHGIEKETIEIMGIGYDNNPNMIKINQSVVFPMISLNHDCLVGFELREVGTEKKIRHTLDAPSCLCIIYDPPTANTLCICEGFKDGYCFYQAMKKFGIEDQMTILTPAHGVDDILANLKDVDFTKYQFCNLILDNDKAGDEATAKIIEKYPFFNDRREIISSYEDVAEWWMKDVRVKKLSENDAE